MKGKQIGRRHQERNESTRGRIMIALSNSRNRSGILIKLLSAYQRKQKQHKRREERRRNVPKASQ